jgi:hypothetical protein
MEDQHLGQEYRIGHNAELPMDLLSEMVNTATERATMAILTALRSSGVLSPLHTAPAPPPPASTNENRLSDENQSETEASQPFQRTCPCVASA